MKIENAIEQELIEKLGKLKYRYRKDIGDRKSLEHNFREKFEELNRVKLTNNEFDRLMQKIITADVYTASQMLRERNTFEREDGTPLHYTLVNVDYWCKNTFEVVNQLRINTKNSFQQYDVIILINGIPVVQIELKNLQINPRKAMQQIVDYKNDPGNGYKKTLQCFLQLFVVSNKSDTWYFANNNKNHFSFNAKERYLPLYQFADKNNKKITGLNSFAEKFLEKCTLGQMISRYMVLVASEKKLMVMRPYQVYAVKAIVDCIQQNCGNGYIWHTTGSGKTLTSFKASTLLKKNQNIDKCLFVVDRKDLDRQTREEFNRFQEGCVEENTNTETLVDRLLSKDNAHKVIVTTIQKLGLALADGSKRNYKQRLKPLCKKRVVLIFDECHRSQFGENHKAIKCFFQNSQLFGFTGTPIFEENSTSKQIDGRELSYKTTESIFQKQLHAYTITPAIENHNVLKFHVDYYKPEGANKPKQGEIVNKELVVKAILEKHDASTARRKFNAVLATASINDAIAYVSLFKTMQKEWMDENPNFKPLNIACVFSPPAEGNTDVQQIQEDLPQEKADNAEEPNKKKEALKSIISDYNAKYKTNHSIGEFDQYYQDVQKRIKDQQYSNDFPSDQKIDVVIVVDMLLTGFDSKFLNTLYVDKNLTYHRLIQAFSRTNRVLNDTKPFGNIFDFRQQQADVEEAITLFSGVEKGEKAIKIWLVDSAEKKIEKIGNAVEKVHDFMTSQGLESKPEEVPNLQGYAARTQFVSLFKEVQRIKTQLDQYTELSEEQRAAIENIMPQERLQAYKGVYLEAVQRLKPLQDGSDPAPEVQATDFELVLFASEVIDYDYIMKLIAKYSQSTPGKLKMTREQLFGIIAADAKFMDERKDIEAYVNTLVKGEGLSEDEIRKGYEKLKDKKRAEELAAVAQEHKLAVDALQSFTDNILQRMIFDDENLSNLLAPLGLGWKERTEQKVEIMKSLIPLLKKRSEGREISGLDTYEG